MSEQIEEPKAPAEEHWLSRDEILNADDLGFEKVAVPEWNGVVGVRSLTGGERGAWERNIASYQGQTVQLNVENMRVMLCYLTMCDQGRKRLFHQKADVLALGRKSAAALERVFKVSMRLSGISEESVEKAAKAFEPDPGDSGSSDSALFSE